MITVSQATAIISEHLYRPATSRVNLTAASGKVLAEPVVADRDFPPFHRVSMDGIAIRHYAWRNGQRSFFIEAIQAAGEEQKELSAAAHCLEVMTGAILPAGCDTVIRYEDVEIKDGMATVVAEAVTPWQSVHRKGLDAARNEVLLEPGFLMTPSEVAMLASVGKGEVAVLVPPRIAIVSTGNELVDVSENPDVFQIRRSNSYALQAALREMGCDSACFHLADERSSMEKSLKSIVEEFDALILSGGVSMGKFDFVPDVLEMTGIGKLFHQVSQRPGKPFWFGSSPSGKVAFALPGNPVSTFMCFYKYVRPWILKSLGIAPLERTAILGTDFSFPPPLTYFLQVDARNEQGRMVAYPNPGGGSGDFTNLTQVNGFLELPLEKNDFRAGEVFPFICFRD